jgi:hypothetical protein
MSRTTIVLALLLFCACKTAKYAAVDAVEEADEMSVENKPNMHFAIPPVVIYKTKADYYHHVPVTLSDDGTAISSFPDIRDVYYGDLYAYPTILEEGYLLDNRGIGRRSVFLDYTYEQYASLEKTPSAAELMQHIMDHDPLLELYVCRCPRDTVVLNQMIRERGWGTCVKLK